MPRKQVLVLVIALAAIQIFASEAFSCSIFSLNRNGQVWFAANEDWPITGFDLWTQPATPGSHGALYIGFGGYTPCCGINDQGLCFDMASVDIKYGPLDSAKRTSDRFVLFKVLETCSSVQEAVDSLARYNMEFLSQSQILLADRFGGSAVIESDSIIVRAGEGPQIITNFRRSGAGDGPAPCDRYRAIERILANAPASLETMRSAAAASHQEIGSATQYSVAFDLKNLQLNICFFYNYADIVTLDLKQELARERYIIPLTDLFPHPPTAYHTFEEKTRRPVQETISLEQGYLDSLAGIYEIAPGYNVEISRMENTLFCRMFGMAPYEIVPTAREKFFFRNLPAEMEIDSQELRIVYPFGALPARRVN